MPPAYYLVASLLGVVAIGLLSAGMVDAGDDEEDWEDSDPWATVDPVFDLPEEEDEDGDD